MAKNDTSGMITSPLSNLLATSSKQLLQGTGAGRLIGAAFLSSPVLAATLLSAGAFYTSKIYAKENEDTSDDKILESLQRTSLNVEIDPSGQLSTTVNTVPDPVKDDNTCQSPVSVENRQGTTIIQIQNLNINLTAQVVEQLNMNPKEVINQLTEQIRETALNSFTQETAPERPKK